MSILRGHRRMVVQPPRHKKAANSPAPDKHGDGGRENQGRHKKHEANTDPEQRKDGGCTEGKGDGG